MIGNEKAEKLKQKILLFLLLFLVASIFYLHQKEEAKNIIQSKTLSLYGIISINDINDLNRFLNQEQKGKLMLYLANLGCPIEDITDQQVKVYEIEASIKKCQQLKAIN